MHPKLSQHQMVGEGIEHGWASVGVLTDQNQERQFGIHPRSSNTINGYIINQTLKKYFE